MRCGRSWQHAARAQRVLLPLGISECLMGRPVRYDGTDAGQEFPRQAFEGLFSYQPVCPEMGIGLPAPRDPIALFTTPDAQSTRIAVHPLANLSHDLGPELRDYAEATARRLPGICGYVFMQNSPSCGLHTVKVHAAPTVSTQSGSTPQLLHRRGRGAFAESLTQRMPLLPVVENTALADVGIRQNFVTRVFAYHRWQQLKASTMTARNLLGFHERHKYLLMAHSPGHNQRAGQLLSDLRGPLSEVAGKYVEELLLGLATPVSKAGHGNVLQHLSGYLKPVASRQERQLLHTQIQAYMAGETTLAQTLASVAGLLQRHAGHPAVDYALRQHYLQPYPEVPGMGERL